MIRRQTVTIASSIAVLLAITLATSARSAEVGVGIRRDATTSCFRGAGAERMLIGYLTSLVTSSDSGTIAVKLAAGLGGVPPEAVSIVTDTTVCRQAAVAARAVSPNPQEELHPVLVARAGPMRYVVDDGLGIGDRPLLKVMDSTFQLVLVILE